MYALANKYLPWGCIAVMTLLGVIMWFDDMKSGVNVLVFNLYFFCMMEVVSNGGSRVFPKVTGFWTGLLCAMMPIAYVGLILWSISRGDIIGVIYNLTIAVYWLLLVARGQHEQASK